MNNKQLKKVFEFIAIMLDDEKKEPPINIVTQPTESPISEDSVGEGYDLPNSLNKLSKKHNLDIDHIRELIKTVENRVEKKSYKNSNENEVLMLKQEIKKIKTDYEDKLLKLKTNELTDNLRDDTKQVERVIAPLDRTQVYEKPHQGPSQTNQHPLLDIKGKLDVRGVEVKDGKLTYVYESETQSTPTPEPSTKITDCENFLFIHD